MYDDGGLRGRRWETMGRFPQCARIPWARFRFGHSWQWVALGGLSLQPRGPGRQVVKSNVWQMPVRVEGVGGCAWVLGRV